MIRGIKGVKDILPAQIPRWQAIETTAHHLARQYGFSEIRIPIFEQTELYSRSIGTSTDIVEKEMYTFEDRDGTSLSLRPEGTAGVVRAFIEHNLAAHFPARKLYYIGPMFRHERPQAGRFRQFHQFGVEAFGTEDPLMDTEVISLLWRYFLNLGLRDLTLYINTLGSVEERQSYVTVLTKYLRAYAERLCKNCIRRMDTNPLRILDCKVPECRAVVADAPLLTDHLSAKSATHFKDVINSLQLLGIPFTPDPRLVRGLDYYSMTTFEITSPSLGAQNTIGAGGRYDGLFQALGGSPTPAVGFAVGLERLALLLDTSFVPPPSPLVFVAGFGQEGRMVGIKLLNDLRSRGITADTDYRAMTLKSLLRSADRLSAMLTLIMGDDEAAKNTVIIRDMKNKKQEEIAIMSAPQRLISWLDQHVTASRIC